MSENDNPNTDDRGKRARVPKSKGFRLSHSPRESEDSQREKEHKQVKVYCMLSFCQF